MLGKLQIVFALLLLWGCEPMGSMHCEFERLPGKYLIQPHDLAEVQNSNLTLVLVSRDGRQFMFRKRDIIACEPIEVIPNE